MCRIDVSFNFSFMFTATLSKWRSKSRRGSFGTYEFGGSISRRFFSIISHWNRCQICCGCQQSKLWIWGKYFSLISIIFVEDETSDQPTIHLWGSFSFNFCIKVISVWTTLQLFCTFIPHICHIHWMGSRSTWVLKSFLFFTVVSSTSKQFKDRHNILLWLNVSVFILFILLLLKHIPLTVATVAIFLHTKDPSLSDGLDAPACFRWKWNVWTVQRLLVL